MESVKRVRDTLRTLFIMGRAPVVIHIGGRQKCEEKNIFYVLHTSQHSLADV